MDAADLSKQHLYLQGTKSIRLYDHDYYGPLIDSYLRSILKSGLLLDEDLEVLLSIYTFEQVPKHETSQIPVRLIVGISSILGSSFLCLLAKQYKLPILLIPPIVVSLQLFYTELSSLSMKKRHKELMNRLIENIQKIHKLNVMVMRYLKTRADLGKTKKQEFLAESNKNTDEFFNAFSRAKYNVFQTILHDLDMMSSYSPELSEDCQFIKDLDVIGLITKKEVKNIEDFYKFTSHIHDIHILLASKVLSYIGALFYSKTCQLTQGDLNTILNKMLPNLVSHLETHYCEFKRSFDSLRYLVHKRCEFKTLSQVANTANSKQISAKLQEPLVSSINNLSMILEKSQIILERIESGDKHSLEEVGNAILDLRNHTFATYESLDLICKLYGILSNYNRNCGDTQLVHITKTDQTLEKELPTISYDEHSEPIEEKYELYVGDEVVAEQFNTNTYEDVKSGAYLSLMLQELKQSLRKHQRFVDAKNRRGSEDDEDIINSDLSRKPRQSLPKFNLGALDNLTETVSKEITPTILEVPMAPPLPLPSFNLENLAETNERPNARSMLDNIKILSSQMNAREDVFGDSDVDSSSSSE